MKLNKRGKRIRALLLATLFIVTAYWLNDITTPKQCKVPVNQMSQYCKDLLFPH